MVDVGLNDQVLTHKHTHRAIIQMLRVVRCFQKSALGLVMVRHQVEDYYINFNFSVENKTFFNNLIKCHQ